MRTTSPNEMSDNERHGGSPSSSANVQRAHEGTTHASGLSNIPFTFSSWEDELRRDESDTVATDDASVISYSYYSTWSSNYTMSNLPGPGRNLGNLYSKAGAALERRLRRRVNRAALKAEKEALEEAKRAEAEAVHVVTWRVFEMLWINDLSENENAREALLICAKYVFLSFRRASLIHDVTFWKDRMTSTSRSRPSRRSSSIPLGTRQELTRPLRTSSRDARRLVTSPHSRGSVQASNTTSGGCIGTSWLPDACRRNQAVSSRQQHTLTG